MTEREQGDELEQLERAFQDSHEVSWAMRGLVRAAQDVDRAVAAALGLRALDYAALDLLWSGGAPLGPVEVSHRLGISTGSGTELVDRLERSGHVARHPHPRDRRRVVLQLTAHGIGEVLASLRPLLDAVDDVARSMPEHEQAVVQRYLRTVTARMRGFTAATDRQP